MDSTQIVGAKIKMLREIREISIAELAERTGLAEEQIERISTRLLKLRSGSKIAITFYSRGHYLSIEGYVSEVNSIYAYIKIGNEKVFFDDIQDRYNRVTRFQPCYFDARLKKRV